MKIQNTKTNVNFKNQYAVYERTVTQGLKPLGWSRKIARKKVGNLIQQIATIEGDGLFVFRQGRVEKDTFTLSGEYVQGQRKGKASHLSFDGEGIPVEIKLPQNAEPETVKEKALRFLEERKLIN